MNSVSYIRPTFGTRNKFPGIYVHTKHLQNPQLTQHTQGWTIADEAAFKTMVPSGNYNGYPNEDDDTVEKYVLLVAPTAGTPINVKAVAKDLRETVSNAILGVDQPMPVALNINKKG